MIDPDRSPGGSDGPPGTEVVAALRERMQRLESSPPVDREEQIPGRPAARRPARSAQGGDDDGPGDPEAVARAIVLRRLTDRAHTRSELERALARKRVPPEAARTVLDRMEEVGLVDDAAFAEAWVESRQQRRHLSRSALRRELMRKGVDADRAEDALAAVDPDDEYAAALDLARRKARTMLGLDATTVRRRLAAALGRRGFGPGLAHRVVDEVTGAQTGGADENAAADA